MPTKMSTNQVKGEGSRITLILIEGRGHSGSNLLDVLISGHSHLVSVGELKQLSRKSWPANKPQKITPCACGEKNPANCDFWQRVGAHIRNSIGVELADLDLLSDDHVIFREHTLAALNAVAAISGTPMIVDSSKSQKRLQRLLTYRELDVRPIFLIRSPVGNVASHVAKGEHWEKAQDSYGRSLLRTSNILQGCDHLKVRYEALVRNPERELRRVMAWLGLPFEPTQLDWKQDKHHRLVANKTFRSQKDGIIMLDKRWRQLLTTSQMVRIWFRTLPIEYQALGLGETVRGVVGRSMSLIRKCRR